MKSLKSQLVAEYKKSLNPNSKWYAEDVRNFTESLEGQTTEKLEQRLSNIICLNGGSASFNRKINKIEKELERGGMYEMGSMRPENALD